MLPRWLEDYWPTSWQIWLLYAAMAALIWGALGAHDEAVKNCIADGDFESVAERTSYCERIVSQHEHDRAEIDRNSRR